MGKVDDNVQTKPSNDTGTVKKSVLQADYESGKSPQQVADDNNVEVEVVMEVLGLNKNAEDLDEFNQPKEAATKADPEPEGE